MVTLILLKSALGKIFGKSSGITSYDTGSGVTAVQTAGEVIGDQYFGIVLTAPGGTSAGIRVLLKIVVK